LLKVALAPNKFGVISGSAHFGCNPGAMRLQGHVRRRGCGDISQNLEFLMQFAFLTAVGAVSLASFACGAQAQSNSDGNWSVTMVTQKGGCDRAMSSSLRVQDGRIDEQSMFARITGGINARGAVIIKVASGSDTIAASGTVVGVQARGSWSSPTRNCSGSWSALRS
jgi:hypothetical protein